MAMIGVVWLVLATSVVLVLWVGPKLERRYRTPKDLRGDWWSKFESEFRAYVRRTSPPRTSPPRSAPERRRDRQRFDH